MSERGQTGAAFADWTPEEAHALVVRTERELARIEEHAAENEGRWPVDSR